MTAMGHHDEQVGSRKMSLLPVSTKGNKYDDKPTSHNSNTLQVHPAFYVAYVPQ